MGETRALELLEMEVEGALLNYTPADYLIMNMIKNQNSRGGIWLSSEMP